MEAHIAVSRNQHFPVQLSDPTDSVERAHQAGDALQVNPFTHRPYSEKYFDILKKRKDLPVWQQQKDFVNILKKSQTLILVG